MSTQKMFQYNLAAVNVQTIVMPFDAIIVSCQYHQGRVTLWAVGTTPTSELDTFERTFYQIGATADLPEKCGHYVGTVQVDAGLYAIHVFEENYNA
jgi:hypothetical protein